MTATGRARLRSEEGMVTAFVVIFVLALLLVLGLVVDGGNLLAARRRASNEAAQAARAGAQAVDLQALRNQGITRLDEGRAEAAAQAYLARVGSTGSVTVSNEVVTVTVTIVQPFLLLPGNSGTVTGMATSEGVQGVTGEIPP